MPKKFKGENSKAVQARQRKESARLEEKERKQKELDDEYWRDDDKHALNKQQRKVCVLFMLCCLAPDTVSLYMNCHLLTLITL